MRVVLDTNVLVRATKSSAGPAREVLGIVASDAHVLIISRHILTELVRVLRYPQVQKLHRLSLDDCREFVASVEQLAEHVEPGTTLIEPVTSDPDDDPVIATALAGHADVLCTLDRHLHKPNVVSHCEGLGLRVVTDIGLLKLLRGE